MSEKLKDILAWAAGADPTESVLRLSAVDYESALHWRNIAVLTIEDVRALADQRDALLAACEAAKKLVASEIYEGQYVGSYSEVLDQLRAAIALARGEQPADGGAG